jgi:hypothetical protein
MLQRAAISQNGEEGYDIFKETIPGGVIVSDFHKEMLDRMYREIPADQKAAFIIDMLKDLPQAQVKQIKAHLDSKSSVDVQAAMEQAELLVKADLAPQKFTQPHASEFQLTPTTSKGQVYRELALFLLMCAGVLAAVIGLAVGAKHLWDWFRAAMGI